MVKTLARQTSYIGCEGQRTVEQHAESHRFSGDLNDDAPKSNGQEPKLKTVGAVYQAIRTEFCPGLISTGRYNPHVTSFCTLLPTADESAWKHSSRRHMSALRVHVVGRLR